MKDRIIDKLKSGIIELPVVPNIKDEAIKNLSIKLSEEDFQKLTKISKTYGISKQRLCITALVNEGLIGNKENKVGV